MGNQYAAIAALFKARLRPGLSEEARRCILSAVVNVSAIGEDPNWRWESFTSVHKIPSQGRASRESASALDWGL